MAERQETSVMVSIQEILRDAQSREEQEKVEAEQRARAEEQRRLDDIRRRQDEEEARLRAEEDDRQRRAFEEKKRHAELAAMQEAAVQRARAETEAKARLAEQAARQEHEQRLHALTHDKSKKNLKFLLAGLGVVLFVAAIGGGVFIKNQMDKTAAVQASANELRAQIDQAEEKRQSLASELAKAQAAGEDTAALKAEIAAQNASIEALKNKAPDKPKVTGGGGGGGGGGAPAAKPAGGGGGGSKPCNCTPGDPLCSCL
jgi:colicin import membrane protein